MPVVFTGWNQHHVAGSDRAFLVVRSHHAGAIGNDQDLIAGVLVELIARAGAEIDDAEVEAFRLSRIDHQLPKDLRAREQWAADWLFRQIARSDDLHWSKSSSDQAL